VIEIESRDSLRGRESDTESERARGAGFQKLGHSELDFHFCPFSFALPHLPLPRKML